ncbi:MAG: helix-turn-helix transcriptional regulator [Actinobacteria bacterium]|nr:helix-turn-helix transcriptional regulator [Actinomycetota bacterium]
MRLKMIRTFFLGFIRLHIVYHASKEPIFGLDMIRELGRHGYELSPGTLYPILHTLEKEGYLASKKQVVGSKVRKYYQATTSGIKALRQAIIKVNELIGEIKS